MTQSIEDDPSYSADEKTMFYFFGFMIFHETLAPTYQRLLWLQDATYVLLQNDEQPRSEALRAMRDEYYYKPLLAGDLQIKLSDKVFIERFRRYARLFSKMFNDRSAMDEKYQSLVIKLISLNEKVAEDGIALNYSSVGIIMYQMTGGNLSHDIGNVQWHHATNAGKDLVTQGLIEFIFDDPHWTNIKSSTRPPHFVEVQTPNNDWRESLKVERILQELAGGTAPAPAPKK
jgi:hypothetical protein